MNVKRILIYILAASAVVYGFYLLRVNEKISTVYLLFSDPRFWVFAVASFGLILIGHLIRSYKFRQIMLPVKQSGVRTQFQALQIGYLFNTLLPFRLGEIVRALVLGRSLKISSSLMFALILLERIVDGIILALMGLAIVAAGWVPSSVARSVMVMCGLIILVAIILGVLLALLYSQNTQTLHFWHGFTGLFNYRLKNSLRFKLWSVIYGLQKLFRRRRLAIYAAQSAAMWVFYLGGMWLLASFFFGGPADNLVRSVTSFLGVSIPSGPAYLGSYQAVTDPVYQALQPGQQSLDWLVASWMMLAIPSSLIGAVLLVRHKTNYGRLLGPAGKDSLYDKLSREADISQEFDAFLDSYFSRNTLAHILHRIEIQDDIRLIKYFKGGSNASTLLVHQNNEYVVKKITPIQYAHRLKSQYEWLKERDHLGKIVSTTGEHEGKDFYSIDIEYHAELIPFFDYIHTNRIERSKDVLAGVFDYLFEYVYELQPKRRHTATAEEYIDNKVHKKLDQACRINADLARLRGYDTVIVNGVEYDNIDVMLKKIRKHEQAWKDICTFRETPIHGDSQVDNILASVKDHSFKIIDPVDQNEVSSPVIDFGRMYQSLGYGYEFLCRDDSPVIPDGNNISYEDSLSASYHELYEFFRGYAAEHLEPEESRAILFHTAVHYSRMSTHRVEINPQNAAKFYGVSVKAFHDFYAQYE